MALALSGSISLLTLSGCGKELSNYTVQEYMESVYTFDLLDSSHKVEYEIVKSENVKGETNIDFVQVITFNQLDGCSFNDFLAFEDYRNYDKYYDKSKAEKANTYLYFDALNGELISIKYVDDEGATDYLLADIISEENAYNYAYTYLGDKEMYTRDDMINLVKLIKEDKKLTLK